MVGTLPGHCESSSVASVSKPVTALTSAFTDLFIRAVRARRWDADRARASQKSCQPKDGDTDRDGHDLRGRKLNVSRMSRRGRRSGERAGDDPLERAGELGVEAEQDPVQQEPGDEDGADDRDERPERPGRGHRPGPVFRGDRPRSPAGFPDRPPDFSPPWPWRRSP